MIGILNEFKKKEKKTRRWILLLPLALNSLRHDILSDGVNGAKVKKLKQHFQRKWNIQRIYFNFLMEFVP